MQWIRIIGVAFLMIFVVPGQVHCEEDHHQVQAGESHAKDCAECVTCLLCSQQVALTENRHALVFTGPVVLRPIEIFSYRPSMVFTEGPFQPPRA